MRRIWSSPEKPKRSTPGAKPVPAHPHRMHADARRVQLVLKLGGSALTDKQRPHTLHASRFDAAVASVVRLYHARIGFIVVHGAGSFGHFEARQYAVTAGAASALGMSRTHAAVKKLNALLVDTLLERGVPAVGVSPLLVPNKIRNDFVATLLDRGHVPVLHGDACYSADGRTAVLSGDVLMASLVNDFQFVTRAVFLSDVPGVYRSPPTHDAALNEGVIRRIGINEDGDVCMDDDDAQLCTDLADHDVTGGMEAKLMAAAKCVAETKGRVVAFIAGVGTDEADCALMGQVPQLWSRLECTRICYQGQGGVWESDEMESNAWARRRGWFS